MVCLLTPGDIFGKGGGGCFEFSNLIIAPATLVRDISCGNQEVGRSVSEVKKSRFLETGFHSLR